MNRSEAILLRLTPEERETLAALVKSEKAKLEEAGSPAHSVSMTSMVVALVVREARARGLTRDKKKNTGGKP